MTIGELIIKLGFKWDGGDKLDKIGETLDKTANTAGKLALGIDLITAGLGYMLDTAAQAAVNLQKFGLSTGLSTTELQQWQHTAKLANVSAEEMLNTVKGLQNVSTNIRLGKGDAQPWVAWLGVNPNQDPFELLKKLHTAFSQLRDDQVGIARNIANQAGISDNVFQMLRQKDLPIDALKQMYLLTPKNQDSLLELNREWQNLLDLTERTKNKFSAELAPGVTGFIQTLEKAVELFARFVGWLDKGSPAAQATKAAIVDLGAALVVFGGILTTYAAVAKIAAVAAGAFNIAFLPEIAAMTALAVALDLVYEGFVKVAKASDLRQHGFAPGGGGFGGHGGGGNWGDGPSGAPGQLRYPSFYERSPSDLTRPLSQGGGSVTIQQTNHIDASGHKDPAEAARVMSDQIRDKTVELWMRTAIQAPAPNL